MTDQRLGVADIIGELCLTIGGANSECVANLRRFVFDRQNRLLVYVINLERFKFGVNPEPYYCGYKS